ncbi:hypothetical protein ACFX14_001271 [Malus domestica]
MDILKSIDPVEKCLRDAKMNITSVHDVVVSGGSSRIPKCSSLYRRFSRERSFARASIRMKRWPTGPVFMLLSCVGMELGSFKISLY